MIMSLTTMLATMGIGMLRTIGIFFLTLIGSLPLGMIIMFGRRSKRKILSAIVKGFISIIRGTPLMLQLLVWYFGPFYLFVVGLPSCAWSHRYLRRSAIYRSRGIAYTDRFPEHSADRLGEYATGEKPH